MKTSKLLFFASIIFLSTTLQAQSTAQKNQLFLDQVSISSDWTDPYYPTLDSPDDLLNYSSNMEAFAKEHPAFPVLRLVSPTTEQYKKFESEVDTWMQQFGMYFPVFVEYSKYDKRLSQKDDYEIYFAAREEWYKRNPDKAKILEEEIGYWIASNKEQYNKIMSRK